MQHLKTYFKNFLLVFIAMQTLNNGLFAQDILDQSFEGTLVSSVSKIFVHTLLNHTNKVPQKNNKQTKQHPHILKKSSLKYFSFLHYKLNKYEGLTSKFYEIYNKTLPDFNKDIIPQPPKA